MCHKLQVLHLNKYAKLVRREGGGQSANELQRASSSWGPFLADSLISCYNIPLIKFKVTLEMLAPKVKKNTEIYTLASK